MVDSKENDKLELGVKGLMVILRLVCEMQGLIVSHVIHESSRSAICNLLSWLFILGSASFGKPNSLSLSPKTLNSSIECHSTRIFLDMGNIVHNFTYPRREGFTCGASTCSILVIRSFHIFSYTLNRFLFDILKQEK